MYAPSPVQAAGAVESCRCLFESVHNSHPLAGAHRTVIWRLACKAGIHVMAALGQGFATVTSPLTPLFNPGAGVGLEAPFSGKCVLEIEEPLK